MGKRRDEDTGDPALRAEAMLLLVGAVERGKIRGVDDYVEDLVARHPGIRGDDAEWYRVCAYGWARHVMRDCMRKFAPSGEEVSPQLSMQGFPDLQIAYPLERNGRQMLVPLSKMTSTECRAKAEEYERFAKGALRHARALRRYADTIDN